MNTKGSVHSKSITHYTITYVYDVFMSIIPLRTLSEHLESNANR
uniref:Uncharacterized protein n=1 Tax=Arundo donax TaxID=35708 RepID=A0A0A9FML8_ARUDO